MLLPSYSSPPATKLPHLPWLLLVPVRGLAVVLRLEADKLEQEVLPFRQGPAGYGTLMVRTTGDPAAVIAAVRREAAAVNARIASAFRQPAARNSSARRRRLRA